MLRSRIVYVFVRASVVAGFVFTSDIWNQNSVSEWNALSRSQIFETSFEGKLTSLALKSDSGNGNEFEDRAP